MRVCQTHSRSFCSFFSVEGDRFNATPILKRETLIPSVVEGGDLEPDFNTEKKRNEKVMVITKF